MTLSSRLVRGLPVVFGMLCLLAASLYAVQYLWASASSPPEARVTRISPPSDIITPVERGNSVRKVCADESRTMPKSSQDSNYLLINKRLDITMCYVPKVGCTFWKRVFLWLKTVREGKQGNVFLLNKGRAHTAKIDTLNDIKTLDEALSYLLGSKRFIFVRDPWKRLFSAYVDKFFVGDFWQYGHSIIRKFRRGSNHSKCGHDVSFTEFLQMVTDRSLSYSLGGAKEHWIPINTICNPCLINYQYVGKMESFDNDRNFLMNELRMNYFVNDNISRNDIARDAMSQIINIYWNKSVENCLSKRDFILRLFESFKIQGYLPLESNMESSAFDSQSQFTAFVVSQYLQRNLTLKEWMEQRHRVMVTAYSKVLLPVKLAVVKYFQWDFKLFGYDPHPSYIFT